MEVKNLERGIKEIEIDDDRIFLKKNNYIGWNIVNPYKIDGKINWKNLLIGGSWIKFIALLILIGLFMLAIGEYANTFRIAQECLESTKFLIIN